MQSAASDDFSNPNKPFVLSSPSGVSKAAQPSIRSLRYAPFDTLRYSGRTGLLRANGPAQGERFFCVPIIQPVIAGQTVAFFVFSGQCGEKKKRTPRSAFI